MRPVLAFVSALLTAATATAQTPDPTKPAESSGVGVRIAVFDPQVALQQSVEGKADMTRLNTLAQRKQAEGVDKQKQLQASQQKLQTSGSVLTNEARAQLEKEIERQQIDLQRFQQDARAELDSLQQDVQAEFAKHLRLAIGEVATEKGIHIVFNVGEPAIAWASPALDVTADVVKKLDARPALPHD